jgi:proteasome lid subunit RPN8/RPN11
MSEPQKEKEAKKSPPVIFEPEAYLKALLHVLRFASNGLAKDSWVEVYGWLVGKIESTDNSTVHIYDTVPIHHGKDIEVTWDAEAYVRAAEFDEQLYQKAEENPLMKGYFVVGWYHSHPGLDFFLSPTDVTNHLGFQGPNPNSIAIVFDHTKIVPYKHLGFKIFRLKEASPESDYSEVEFDKAKFTKDVVDVMYQAQAIVERIQGNQLFTSEISEVPSIFAHLMLPGATPQIDKAPPIDLDALFDKMLKSTEALIQKVLGNSIIGKLATEMNPALEEWYSAFIPYVISSLNKWLLVTAEKLITTNKLALGSIYTIAGALEKSMKNVNEWTKAQLGDSERHVKKLVETTHAKLATGIQEKLAAQEKSLSTSIDGLTQDFAKVEGQDAKLADKVTALAAQIDALQQKTAASIASIEAIVDSIGKKIDGMESTIQAKVQERLDAVNKGVDETLKGLDTRMAGHLDGHVQQLGKDIAGIRDAIKADLGTISGSLAKERAALDELAASKSIKKMQDDLHKLVK